MEKPTRKGVSPCLRGNDCEYLSAFFLKDLARPSVLLGRNGMMESAGQSWVGSGITQPQHGANSERFPFPSCGRSAGRKKKFSTVSLLKFQLPKKGPGVARCLFLLQKIRPSDARWLFLLQKIRPSDARWLFLLLKIRLSDALQEFLFRKNPFGDGRSLFWFQKIGQLDV